MSEKEYPTEDKPQGNEYPTDDQPQDEYPTEDNAQARDAEAHEPVEDGSETDKKGSEAGAAPEEKKGRNFKCTPGVLIFVFCVLVAFVFCLAGMSLGMFDSRENNSCISIWGYKPRCLGSWFRHMDFEDFRDTGLPCKKADSLVQGAQAFSVMCIIGGFLSVVVGLLEVFNYAELAVVAGIMSCINTVATLVVWSTMTAMYWSNLCGTGVYADTHKLGVGLILFITAWCLQMVGNVALIVDIYLGNVK